MYQWRLGMAGRLILSARAVLTNLQGRQRGRSSVKGVHDRLRARHRDRPGW